MGCPGEWKQGLKPAVTWWFNLDPYPLPETEGTCVRALGTSFMLTRNGTWSGD